MHYYPGSACQGTDLPLGRILYIHTYILLLLLLLYYYIIVINYYYYYYFVIVIIIAIIIIIVVVVGLHRLLSEAYSN